MKLQGLSIIFGLIVIPMVLVLSYYIQLQVDTITLQTSYDTKLLDSTHGAMVAFELNTANEDLSSVADSLRSIIEASNNIFMNTLATNMGLSNASKSYLEPYIPAILYTLYDGYYINSPTKKPEIAETSTGVAIEIDEGQNTDGSATGKFSMPGLKYISGNKYLYDPNDPNYYSITGVPAEDFSQLLYKLEKVNDTDPDYYTTNINESNIHYNIENILKSYMPYAARYVKNDIDVTINYTLDNYLTVVGNIGECYYTKSGYLIDTNLVSFSTDDGAIDVSNYNENDAEKMILAGTKVTVVVDGQKITTDGNANSDKTKAVIYYTKAKIFSDWIYNNLGDGPLNTRDPLLEKDITENTSNEIAGKTENAEDDVVYTFKERDSIIFSINVNPEKEDSTFAGHKYQVIRNFIQYNLNLAMSIYNQTFFTTYDFKMPVISNEEWEKITTNISIVSFMQGLNCGLKKYNNYAIVSSTNNELTVLLDEIYFTNEKKFTEINSNPAYSGEDVVYHRIDCPILKQELDELNSDPSKTDSDKLLTSFKSKEVKYDKVYNKNTGKYDYDHKGLACYTCIVDGNYNSETLDDARKLAYYTAIGKQRYSIYKMNAIKYSEGYEMILDKSSNDSTLNSAGKTSTRTLKEIKKVEVTFGNIDATDFSENIVRFLIPGLNGTDIYVLNTNQAKEQTIEVKINSTSSNKLTVGQIRGNVNVDQNADPNFPLVNQNSPTTVENNILAKAIKAIKVVYK